MGQQDNIVEWLGWMEVQDSSVWPGRMPLCI